MRKILQATARAIARINSLVNRKLSLFSRSIPRAIENRGRGKNLGAVLTVPSRACDCGDIESTLEVC
jgi:hypothetical protein